MEEQKNYIMSRRSGFPEQYIPAFQKAYDYLWSNYFGPDARFDVAKMTNYSKSIEDGHHVTTNNSNETLNAALNKFIGNSFNSKNRLADKLRSFYKKKDDVRQSFKKSKTIGLRSKYLLQKFAEHKHIHDEYFRQISWTLHEQHLVPHLREETERIAYNMFIEASFKLGRITDCDPKVGKNFFRACEDFTELGISPVYFPFVPCEFV